MNAKKLFFTVSLFAAIIVGYAQEGERMYDFTINVKGTDSTAARQEAEANLINKCALAIYDDICKHNYISAELRTPENKNRIIELITPKIEMRITSENWTGKKCKLKGSTTMDAYLVGKDVEAAFNQPQPQHGQAMITFVPAADQEPAKEETSEPKKLTDGERQAAQEYFKQALHAESEKSYASAIEYYKKGIELNPTSAEPYFKIGNAYSALYNYDEAINAYNKALEIKPDYADVLFNLGNAYLDKRDFDNAITSYQKALLLDGTNKDIYYNLGTALFEKGDQQQAISTLQNAAKYGSREAQIWLQSNKLSW